MVKTTRRPLLRFQPFLLPLWLALFSSIGSSNPVDDAQAREQVKTAVRAAMKLPSTHFLRAVRCEDLEDDLFSFQIMIKGKIAKFAYFYQVTESGYEIVSPDEVVFHSSVDGSREWYAAVSRETGEVYGLFGFEKAAEAFNRLATAAALRIDDELQAKNYAGLYWRCALGSDYGVIVDDLRDLKRQVDDMVYNYRLTTNGQVSFERWWRGFEASGVKPQFGVQARKVNGTYSIACSSVILPISKIPALQNVAFPISEKGTVGTISVRPLYPRSATRR